MVIVIPQGNIEIATDDWMRDTTPEAIRLDVTTLALAAAEARHRVDPTEENTLRLTAAQVSASEAYEAYWHDTWPL